MAATDDPVLLSDDRDGVRTLTLNRPHRKNAITPELWIALRDALDGAGRDRSVCALVITGAGGAFAPAPTFRSAMTSIPKTSCSA